MRLSLPHVSLKSTASLISALSPPPLSIYFPLSPMSFSSVLRRNRCHKFAPPWCLYVVHRFEHTSFVDRISLQQWPPFASFEFLVQSDFFLPPVRSCIVQIVCSCTEAALTRLPCLALPCARSMGTSACYNKVSSLVLNSEASFWSENSRRKKLATQPALLFYPLIARTLRNVCVKRRSDFKLCTLAQTSSLEEAANPAGSSVNPGGVETRTWKWRNYNIRYQSAGLDGPALVLIHGFGSNCDHWRKNIPQLSGSHKVYAIDLLGYGYSDKPDPRGQTLNTLYTFETWAQQVIDFCDEIVKDSAFLICNSIGGIVGLQSALMHPQRVRGLVLLNLSLRMLQIKKQNRLARPFVRALQDVLRKTDVGQRFFKSVATAAAVKRILCQCYHDDTSVTDELVEKILKPGLLPGAAEVFLDFISYSGGPLPEELLPEMKCPVLIGWGEKGSWEPVQLGRAFGNYSTVENFVVFPNVGHCPQDEAPHLVNPFVEDFVKRHS